MANASVTNIFKLGFCAGACEARVPGVGPDSHPNRVDDFRPIALQIDQHRLDYPLPRTFSTIDISAQPRLVVVSSLRPYTFSETLEAPSDKAPNTIECTPPMAAAAAELALTYCNYGVSSARDEVVAIKKRALNHVW